ncbi:uncharacterized protein LOC135467580 [Liolophura sinensis]|uniref:uncharacterized protein LOC135467580 n=1 Tax=Liolophura sinensis TaxID=3198878 RepID=UPI0031585258
MRRRQRKLKQDDKIEVKRPCPSDPGIIPCFDGKKPATGPALKMNKVFRLRVERARREVSLPVRQRENVWDSNAYGYKGPRLASRSSSYILESPSVAGVPYILTPSHPPQPCPGTAPGPNKLDVIGALTWRAWTDIKTRLHKVLQTLVNMLSSRKREDKSTSTSEDSA